MCGLDVRLVKFGFLLAFLAAANAHLARAVEPPGVTVRLDDGSGSATVDVVQLDRFRFQVTVDPSGEEGPLVIRVELPISGREAWPIADVEVLDANGQSVTVIRGGIEWHKLSISVPATPSSWTVRAEPHRRVPPPTPEQTRHVADVATGLTATITPWFDGRRTALSIRFDDSHPSHLSKAIPILNEYGFRGTFMVNPGGHPPGSRRRSAFEQHRAEWEAVAKRGRHEFANHTMHHRGAKTDDQMDHEVGQAAEAIWKLFPAKSRLVALNLGGGTKWATTKTLTHYLDKYHLFDASSNSTGMDDSYGNRVATFRRLLEAHIERGIRYKVHYHYIGEGLSSSEANFRAALDIAKEHQADLWIAGIADVHKYQTERQSSQLVIENASATGAVLRMTCSTDPKLYDQPLTIEVGLPKSWPAGRILVKNADGKKIVTRTTQTNAPVDSTDGGLMMIRFDVVPVTSRYSIEVLP